MHDKTFWITTKVPVKCDSGSHTNILCNHWELIGSCVVFEQDGYKAMIPVDNIISVMTNNYYIKKETELVVKHFSENTGKINTNQ